MKLLFILNIALHLSGSQHTNWQELAKNLIPQSKTEILTELQKANEKLMKGDSVKFLWNMDSPEYSYRNEFEFYQVLNKARGYVVGMG